MNVAEYDNLSPSEAIAYQNQLKGKIKIQELDKPIKTIAGADISFNKYEETVYAGIVVLSYPELQIIDSAVVISKSKFPYISGLLAFREIPSVIKAFENLNIKPDLLVLDGQGIAHRRRLGIATHFGLITDFPTIGCGKSRLFGTYTEPANEQFATSTLFDKDEIIGTVLRSKPNCKPLFISPGHRINTSQSIEIIKSCIIKHRIPEPTRLAHLLVNQARIEASTQNQQENLFDR